MKAMVLSSPATPLAHAGRRVVSAFAQETMAAANIQWRNVADHVRPTVPKLATHIDNAVEEVHAYMGFAPQPRTKLLSTKALKRERREQALDRGERNRPHNDAITRLVGAILLKQRAEWASTARATRHWKTSPT